MPPESNAKGDRRERELVNRLDELGFAVMRAPASGSATSRELPDVLAGDGRAFYAIEVKASGGNPIYLDEKEVYDLVYFADSFGATARLGVRFDREDWYFFHPYDDHVHRTEAGSYRIKKETALDHGEPIDDLSEPAPDDDAEDEKREKVLLAVERGHLTVEDAIEML